MAKYLFSNKTFFGSQASSFCIETNCITVKIEGNFCIEIGIEI